MITWGFPLDDLDRKLLQVYIAGLVVRLTALVVLLRTIRETRNPRITTYSEGELKL
jgi:hypothetical protein